MESDGPRNVRNVLILLVLAAIIWKVPGGKEASGAFRATITLLFWGGAAFFAYKLYMERRESMSLWEDRDRVKFYLSVGLLMIVMVAALMMIQTGGIVTLLWFAAIGVAIWGIFTSIRSARSY